MSLLRKLDLTVSVFTGIFVADRGSTYVYVLIHPTDSLASLVKMC